MAVTTIRPLSVVIDEIKTRMRTNIENSIKSHKRSAETTIKAVEQNRQALALLSGAGFSVSVPDWDDGSEYTLDLGFFGNSKKDNRRLAEQVRKVRLALECHLTNEGKRLCNASMRRVEYTLVPDSFKGIRVQFRRRLPKAKKGDKPKCRIVTQRSTYRTLVCDI